MGDLRETFMKSIERDYGVYPGRSCEQGNGHFESERDRIRRWLFLRFDQNREVFVMIFDAIRENIPPRYGAPDLATIKRAVERYQEEYGVRLYAKPEARDFVPIVRTEEDIWEAEKVQRLAEEAGINTQREGWFTEYLLRETGRNREGMERSA